MTTVNRPTNVSIPPIAFYSSHLAQHLQVKQKEADVNQKLQLYGIYSGTSRYIAAYFAASFGGISG